ncbi:hypothetical protein [Oligoflexus tunisiensis]|uniref:hypothetical protein n=1 Tax=Oligoflexus tunisiensis TaxID=708132 RepID=UPI00114CDA7A|nr:hypothetical protein [Oligoflexus tunisiensis]
MNDPLHDYLKKHQPPVPPAPADEWQRILARTRKDRKTRAHRVWLYASAMTLSAAALMAFLNFRPAPEMEVWLEPEDVFYQERTEIRERGAYHDWLWLAEQVAPELGE